MKKIQLCFAALFLAVLTVGRTWSHGDPSDNRTLTGEVVCLSCYLDHGAMGAKHSACAKDCLGKGLPVGLKVGDKLYLLVGEKHGSANKMLKSHSGEQVTLTGRVVEEEGMRMMMVASLGKPGSDKDEKKK